MRAVMIRDGDYYVGLRERIQKARAAKADLFVSLHADAFSDRRVRGTSVYALSSNGASSEHARWLAERENAADLIGGVSLRDKDDQLASFMLDLSQGASIEASLDVGGRVLANLAAVADLHKHGVQQAGFLVLKSPDIPSILVETAFISNPAEERRLRDPVYQRRLAEAVLDGVDGYLASYRPQTQLASARRHEVKAGETLSGIALRYRIDTAHLRRINGLAGDTIRVGQVLEIPAPQERLAASTP
jgi:N-acetylmuramoyl-L-alanine amidase